MVTVNCSQLACRDLPLHVQRMKFYIYTTTIFVSINDFLFEPP